MDSQLLEDENRGRRRSPRLAIKTFHIFRHGGEAFCLNGDNLGVQAVAPRSARLLAGIESNRATAEVPKACAALKKLGLLRLETANPPPAPGPVSALTRDLFPLATLAEDKPTGLLAMVKARERNPAPLTSMGPPIACLWQRRLNKEKKMFFRGRGRVSLTVSGQGGLYPCHRFVGDKPSSLGGLDSANQGREAFSARLVVLGQPCASCLAKYPCG